jgi:hypothetical protein
VNLAQNSGRFFVDNSASNSVLAQLQISASLHHLVNLTHRLSLDAAAALSGITHLLRASVFSM